MRQAGESAEQHAAHLASQQEAWRPSGRLYWPSAKLLMPTARLSWPSAKLLMPTARILAEREA